MLQIHNKGHFLHYKRCRVEQTLAAGVKHSFEKIVLKAHVHFFLSYETTVSMLIGLMANVMTG
jgi:hypothetical protein